MSGVRIDGNNLLSVYDTVRGVRDWCIEYFDKTHPYAAPGGGGYVNFNTDLGEDRVRASYGPNFARLQQIKAVYDPTNFFHVNQNVPPK